MHVRGILPHFGACYTQKLVVFQQVFLERLVPQGDLPSIAAGDSDHKRRCPTAIGAG
jgi:hypothetical protein